jgi:hypothetical protein
MLGRWLLCKAQNIFLPGQNENLMPKTLLLSWSPTAAAQA